MLTPEKAAACDIAAHLTRTLDWCRDKLGSKDKAYLESFVPFASVKIADDKKALFYHGSPVSSTDSVDLQTPEERLDLFFPFNRPFCFAAGGHTHVQMFRSYRDIPIVNPGSVGCTFQTPFLSPTAPSLLPIAAYAIVTYESGLVSVDLRRIPFDIAKFVTILRRSDLPLKEWWLAEYKRLGYESC